ncbi:sigma-70 family RNA polymerase sigma factor [Mesobacillus zeae]|uniref:Sigma-70 family RNA polymerase sigma factor n=1 Tax=Mesobacillus zeae TaxID=1917180 RepID=A0A398B406_9BACI|nr:sigma-70 family RNA polymerase sigma factor [Mesobacillus zeae]RID82690.1 sigma-70 family RNA polymerase sigma factor [Mesobacillus zeae]
MESFEQLHHQYTPMIHSIMHSLHIYKNKDEFFQLGMIGLWEASKRFDEDKGSFTNYAYNTIRGLFLTELSKSSRIEQSMISVKDEFWDTIKDESPSSPLETELLLGYCTGSRLTEMQTKWVLCHCLHGMSIKEIAQTESVSPSAVKQWRAGARDKLRKAIPAEQNCE